MDWQVPLVIAAILFGGFMVWRVRPAFSVTRRSGPGRAGLRDAKERIRAAKTDEERALALCDAGDACAFSLGRTTGAIGYYLRAMRTDPASADLVRRAAHGLARRPYALESLLWRRLGAEPWTGESRGAAVAALQHLAHLYDGPLRNRARGRAIVHALAAMGEVSPLGVEEPGSSTGDLEGAS
jgi:hypothetical protein